MIPKFRAWHKDSQTMYEVKSLVFTLNRALGVNRDELYPERTLDLDDDSTILMQSTGLLDKDGVEIFEGDVVVVLDSIYTVFYDDKTASFRLKPHDKRWNTDYMSNYAHDDSFEVVGNIYETPELLEEKDDQT